MILIGCPVSRREWILDRWFDHVEVAVQQAGVDAGFIFVLDPERDPDHEIIMRRAPAATIIPVIDPRPTDQRIWSWPRYQKMVALRNALLGGVREIGPTAFFSLDSDILLAPEALVHVLPLLANAGPYDAVGAKCYLSEVTTKAPNYGIFNRSNRFQRSDFSGITKVDVLMAAKLMSPRAYEIDYEIDREGEDIGWSRACKRQGLSLGWCGTVVNKHVFDPSRLDKIDRRVGW